MTDYRDPREQTLTMLRVLIVSALAMTALASVVELTDANFEHLTQAATGTHLTHPPPHSLNLACALPHRRYNRLLVRQILRARTFFVGHYILRKLARLSSCFVRAVVWALQEPSASLGSAG